MDNFFHLQLFIELNLKKKSISSRLQEKTFHLKFYWFAGVLYQQKN